MDIQYYGANCLRITTKGASITIDDNLEGLGAKSPMKSGDIALYTSAHDQPSVETKIIIDQPGEYEVSNVSVEGIDARAHMDEEGQSTATILKLSIDDVRVLITGHIYPELSDEQLEAIGVIDVMVVPVGGNGYTLDPVGALKLIKKVEPKIVIPTHYSDKSLQYPVLQQELDQALQQLGMEPKETTPKLKIKEADLLGGTQLVVLEKLQ